MRILAIELLVFSLLCLSNLSFCQIGVFSVNGNLTISEESFTKIQLKDLTGAGNGHDQIAVTGNIIIDGALDLELDGYTPDNLDQFEIIKIDGSISGVFNTINWPIGMDDWSIDYGILNPGYITIYGSNNTLPIELVHFNVEAFENFNLISFITSSEINNDYFLIEYSVDGRTFKPLSKIKGKKLSNELTNYNYKHHNLDNTIFYYRILQVDINGNKSYTEIISINRKVKSNDIFLYPNPSYGTITFSIPIKNVTVYNSFGKRILELENPGKTLDLNNLVPGIYFLNINNSADKLKLLML